MRQTRHQHTAILFFSKTSSAEAEGKKLAAAKRQTKAIAQVFIKNTRQILRGLDLPVFTISENLQRGDSFGERLQNAFQDVFDKGFTNVIAIGNDCLTMSKLDILTAADALKTAPSVLGATNDGGAYLIGFQKIVFQKNVFQSLSWQTNAVFSELTLLASETIFLEQKSDINRVSDWQKTLETVCVFLKKILTRLLYFVLPMPSVRTIFPINSAFLHGPMSLRAPPVCRF